MPPGEVHDGISYRGSPYELKTFRISPELVQGCFSDLFDLNNLPEFGGAMIENHHLSQQLVSVFNHLKQQEEVTSLPFEEQWLKVLLPLLENLTRRKSAQVKGALSDKHLGWVMEYCNENLSGKITLEQLSALSGLNRYQFLRRFEKSVGITPHKWLTQLRLEKACQQMRRSDKSIVDIASEVGFFDQSHFNRAFKSLYGVAPSKY
jgi:AraC-like DNA-binding protein